MVAGAARIKVTFQVDADGLLNVSAREETTGAESNVTVKPSFGLAEEEIAQMLQASYSHAGEDMLARKLAEQRLDAQQLLEGLDAALRADGETLLTDDERQVLAGQMAAVRERLPGEDIDALRLATDELGRASEAFATRRMDRSIREALAGVSLDELDDEVKE